MTDMTRPTRPDLSCDEVRELAASFVLGALEPDQADAVRAHLASCADAHIEMAELGSVLPVLADSVPVVEPPRGAEGPDPGGCGRRSRDARGRGCRRAVRASDADRASRADSVPDGGRAPAASR